jgi:hypothetical protein
MSLRRRDIAALVGGAAASSAAWPFAARAQPSQLVTVAPTLLATADEVTE